MSKHLTFIVPVRHPENARNWAQLKCYLAQTLASIVGQDGDGWQAVVVANRGADLPRLPRGVEVAWVDHPPNPLHERQGVAKEAFLDAVRLDKGRRILVGMLHAHPSDYFMVVDDDDLVSRRLAGFVAARCGAPGWYVRDGYVWSTGSRLMYSYADFSKLCGTSHIVRSDLFNLPRRFEDAADEYVMKQLGSHIFIGDHLAATNAALSPLPFPGAVYRVGHAGSHSRSTQVAKSFFLRPWVLRQPAELMRRARRLRWISGQARREFFGAPPE